MTISGFSFVRNGVRFDYPFLESISSILPLCDEFVVAVGASDDDTLEQIRSLRSPKIRIIETVWDDALRTGGEVLARQTDIALEAVQGDWAFYLQADEVVHEDDHEAILAAVRRYDRDPLVEGLLFSYRHFYGSHRYVGISRQWYRREIRIVRTGIGVRSWGDAQGFRIDGRKLKVVPVDATIHHYGWVKPPRLQQDKQRSFNRYWHSDDEVADRVGAAAEYEYAGGGRLMEFQGTHPAVMARRVAAEDWSFRYDPSVDRRSLRHRVLDWIEAATGIRIGEYRNYELL